MRAEPADRPAVGTRIRYRLPVGDRFSIEASAHERVLAGDALLVDLQVSFALDCEVVDGRDGAVEIAARFRDPKVTGTTPDRLPDVESLDGRRLRVVKRLDGRFLSVDGADPLDRMIGGLTALNTLRWFAAVFPDHPVSPGHRWSDHDVWTLRADRTPLGIGLPLAPRVRVDTTHRLATVDDHRAEVDTAIAFGGGGSSAELGLELLASGGGRGRVVVDLAAGKLRSSVKEAELRLVPVPVRPGAFALPPLVARRRSEAGFVV